MSRKIVFGVLLAAWMTVGASGWQGRSVRPGKTGGAPADPTEAILKNHSRLDVDGDGIFEIDELSMIDRAPASCDPNADLVVVFVEPRLLDLPSGRIAGRSGAAQDFLDRLDRFQKDLAADGFPNHLVRAKVYNGIVHQDGRTVIAFRRLLKAFRGKFPNLRGAVFVGSFPEPMIARKWVWKRSAKGLNIGGKDCPANGEYVRIVPEIISERSDLVLADLTGPWDGLYQKGPLSVEAIEAVPEKKLA
ncbi:MAG: hypothetical protein JW843_08940, partial [Candidatus Aminicenantes bacterium]|nr:hypothetical protein [Candidatus Aminicenantes bacterium]